MLLNNFYNSMNYLFTHTMLSGSGSNDEPVDGVISMDGTTLTMAISFYANYGGVYKTDSRFPYKNLIIYTGTSDLEESANQYSLGNEITLSNVTNTTTYNQNQDGTMTIRLTYGGRNGTDNEIVIKEIGVAKLVRYGTNNDAAYNTSTNAHRFLYIRKVLDTPITVPPNSYCSITVDWKIT
ncbi:MAG: hypothetical protein J6Y02_20605 [Pseudobutyrivibrio sp.]|nr:hypothetical protein [Pseudobutyrivibrio sp.]